jgi:hypothetical protein
VVPERRRADPPEITPDAPQRFFADWPFAHAPVEAIALGTAMCRQPGGVVITSLAGFSDLPHWWRLLVLRECHLDQVGQRQAGLSRRHAAPYPGATATPAIARRSRPPPQMPIPPAAPAPPRRTRRNRHGEDEG